MMNGENDATVSGTLHAGRSWKKNQPVLAPNFLLVISKVESHG